MEANENQSSGMSRRDLLKKGAVAGGIVWTAPVVLGGVAGAQVGTGSPNPCTTLLFAKFGANGSGVITSNLNDCEDGVGQNDCLNGVNGYSKGDPEIQSLCSAIVGIDSDTNTIYLAATISTASGSMPLQEITGYVKAANNACGSGIAATPAASATYPTAAWQIEFPFTNGGNATSHVEIAACV